jgi:hypothetical protein
MSPWSRTVRLLRPDGPVFHKTVRSLRPNICHSVKSVSRMIRPPGPESPSSHKDHLIPLWGDMIKEFRDLDKLGQGFTSADPLAEIDIGDGKTLRPTFVNKTLETDPRNEMIGLLKEYSDCFAWNYTEMSRLSREIVEHRLSIKSGFRPFKQKARTFRPDLLPQIKDEIHRLLEANFIRPCRYAKWVSNIVSVEKESGKLRVCIDFRNLNRATSKDEYPMPIADTLINNASGNRIISFLDGNAGYNQIFMAEEDTSKIVFICSGFIGLFEWVVMTFGLKNTGATY